MTGLVSVTHHDRDAHESVDQKLPCEAQIGRSSHIGAGGAEVPGFEVVPLFAIKLHIARNIFK